MSFSNRDPREHGPHDACPHCAPADLVDMLEGALDADRESALRRHLGSCARCRGFVAQWQSLDARLATALPRPMLSVDFESRLKERVAAERQGPARETIRAGAEQDYRRALGVLRQGLGWFTALESLAAASIAGGLVVGAQHAWPDIARSLFRAGVLDLDWLSQSWTTAVFAAIAVGGAYAWRRFLTGGAPLAH